MLPQPMTTSPINDASDDSPEGKVSASDVDSFDSAQTTALAKDLPDIEPPSAGFIVQLFVIPAIIVMAVLGVWLLFGQLATGELDWRRAVANIKSENPHIRWRAAKTLADMLKSDERRGDEGQHLAENIEIARALCDIYDGLLTQQQFTEEEREQLEFLSKAVGQLNVPEVVNPVLVSALEHEDEDIQRQGLIAAAMSAGVRQDHDQSFDDAEVIDATLDLSYSETSLIRQLAVYVLGLSTSDAAQPRMIALLTHGDVNTRINAAIGLARQGSTAGLETFEEVIEETISSPPAEPGSNAIEEQETYAQKITVLNNTIKAIEALQDSLSDEERAAWAERLQRLADVIDNDVIRLQALELREKL